MTRREEGKERDPIIINITITFIHMKIITLHNPGSIYGREDEDDDDEDDDGCIS